MPILKLIYSVCFAAFLLTHGIRITHAEQNPQEFSQPLIVNSATEIDVEIKTSVIKLMDQFAAVVNSGRKEIIGEFMRFYADRDASFIKNSKLYDPFLADKIIGQENLEMNRDQYINYLYHISSIPLTYSMNIKVTNVSNDKNGNITAAISMNEISVAAIKNSANLQNDPNNKNNVKINVATNCNISLRRSSTLIITGSNCIEKIRPQ